MKRIVMLLSTAIMLLSAAPLHISALGTPQYEINSEAYRREMDSLGLDAKIAYEQELVDYYNELYGDRQIGLDNGDGVIRYYNVNQRLVHVYNLMKSADRFDNGIRVVFEYEKIKNGKKVRYFSEGAIYVNGEPYWYLPEVTERFTIDELNTFLSDNGYKAHFEMSSNGYYQIVYDDVSEENVMQTFLAVAKKFDVDLPCFHQAIEGAYFYDEPDLSLTSAVKFQRYLSHSAELTDSEMTDFDLNGDGNLNVIDLIMMKRKLTDMNK